MNRPVADCKRSRSAGVSLSPSASHAAETENQSIPLPCTINRGRSGCGDRNRRWNAGLPRYSAWSGRSGQTVARWARKLSLVSPTQSPGSGVNQSRRQSHWMAFSRRGSSRIRGFPVRSKRGSSFSHSWPVQCHKLLSSSLFAAKRSRTESSTNSNVKRGWARWTMHNWSQLVSDADCDLRNLVNSRWLNLLTGSDFFSAKPLSKSSGGALRNM